MARRKGVIRQRSGSNHLKTRKKLIRKTEKQTQPNSEIFDKNLTFKKNLQNLGWMVDINKRIDKATEPQQGIEVEEEIDIKNLQNGQITLEKRQKKICQEDKSVIEDLQKRYKDNFDKMFNDIKINKYQWNKNKIQKTYNLYLEIYGQFN